MSTISNAARQLEEFLLGRPAYQRKVFELYTDPNFTVEEVLLVLEDIPSDALTQQYMELLEQVPGKAKWYQKRAREIYGSFASLMPMPRVRRGRPQKDADAEEMAALENAGLSHGETAAYLNDKYATEIDAGNMTKRTRDNVRKLLSLRRRRQAIGAPSPSNNERLQIVSE
jgi:hypothetical protein